MNGVSYKNKDRQKRLEYWWENFDIEVWLKKWWAKKDMENQKWFLYKTLAILAILVSYVTTKITGSVAAGIYAAMVVVLLGLHTVIWPFFTETTSFFTKLLVSLFLIFVVITGFIPDYTERKMSATKAWVKDFNKNGGKVKDQAPQVLSTAKDARKPRDAETIQLRVVPGARFKTAYIPPGSAAASWECPDGCFIEIEHDGEPLCQNGMYSGVECWVEALSSSGKKRQVEQFEIKPGVDVDFPQKLGNSISRFGTSREIGPVDVVVNIVHNR